MVPLVPIYEFINKVGVYRLKVSTKIKVFKNGFIKI